VLKNESALRLFLESLEWVVHEIKKSGASE
jgi:hypothetical protein